MRRWQVRWGALTVSMGALVGAALAQAPAERLRDLFQRLDKDHDGVVEKDEVPAKARSAFESLLKRGDANQDGKLETKEFRKVALDLREFATRAREKAERRFKVLDKDRDGKITRSEFPGKKARFDRLDRDKNGSLTRQELLGGMGSAGAGAGPGKGAKKAAKNDSKKKPRPEAKERAKVKKESAADIKAKARPEKARSPGKPAETSAAARPSD